MTPPPQKLCQVPGCTYQMLAGIPSHELLQGDIRLHLVMVHPEAAAALGAMNNQAGPPGPQSSVKAQKLGEDLTLVSFLVSGKGTNGPLV